MRTKMNHRALVVPLLVFAGGTLTVCNRSALATPSTCETVEADLETLYQALAFYQTTTGELPPRLTWRETLIREHALAADSPEKDPWGHGYVYRSMGTGFEVFSVGPDGKHGTPDDQPRGSEWKSRPCEAPSRFGCAF